MVLALCRPDDSLWSGKVSRGLSGTGAWGNVWHGISMCGQPLDVFGGRLAAQGVGRQSSGCRGLVSSSAHRIALLKSTRQSPGGFVPSWHQICSQQRKTRLSELEKAAVAAWILLGIISRASCGESVAGMFCRLWGGTAKRSPVFILFLTCIALLHPQWGLGGCSVSRAYPWSLRWTRQLVEGMLVSWSVGVRPDTCLSLAVWGDYLASIKPEQFFMS